MQKNRTCKVCHVKFSPSRPLQSVCSPACAIVTAARKRKREAELHARDESKKTRERLHAIKSRAQLLREAQAAFNRYIRYRDKDRACISCGKDHTGQYHAGHYLSTGARPELRFDELNVHKQCQPCNTHLHGNLVLYRRRLIDKIGLDKVEWLEGPHDACKWTREELIEIKKKYSSMAREVAK